MNVGSWTWSRTMHVIIYFKYLPQICTKMNDFKFDFSWEGLTEPPPQTHPRVFSGFALGSSSALNSLAKLLIVLHFKRTHYFDVAWIIGSMEWLGAPI